MAYFEKNGEIIAIEQINGFGKKTALWIGNRGVLTKVATFRNDKSADDFTEYLRRFFRPHLEENENP